MSMSPRRSFLSRRFSRSLRDAAKTAPVTSTTSRIGVESDESHTETEGDSRSTMLPELRGEIMGRMDASEDRWPQRQNVVACACVCKRWRDVNREIIKASRDSGRITFPSCLKQVIEKGNGSEEVEFEQKFKRTDIEGSQTIGVDESGSKKIKLSTPTQKVEFEVSFSVSATKDKYKDALLLPKWKAFKTSIFLERDEGLHDSRRIAAFDFDGCLAKTSVKRVGAEAWSLMYPSIPEKLQKLYSDGYKLVIFTNESNIERWKNKRQVAVDSKIGRLNNFIKKAKVPMQVFIACGFDSNGKGEDPFRKPKPGMWHIMEKYFNSDIPIDMDQSFYVGDAAGRENDHSDADIKFAQAIGLKFYVPEEYFST